LSRPCRAVFDPIDRTLGNAGSFTKIGLAPPQHGPAGADLGGKQLPLVLNTARRHIYFCVFVHERVFVHEQATNKKACHQQKNPRREVPPGIVEFTPRSSDQGRKSR
jgi:hypothetical protein